MRQLPAARRSRLTSAVLRAAPRDRPMLVRWVLAPALAGAVLSANIDLSAPPILGPERVSAVFLLDGQAYFGHLDDMPWSETLTLRDVYYFQDARSTTTNLPLALVKRGSELHAPVGGLRIRRDKVLVVERVGPGSQVEQAIAAQRAIEKRSP